MVMVILPHSSPHTLAHVVFTLLANGLSGIGCVLVDIPVAQIAMYIMLMVSGITTNIITSSTVEIYPTQTRWMWIINIICKILEAFLSGRGNFICILLFSSFDNICRGMAVCISLMFARLGSAMGSAVGAILLESHCEYAFFLSGATLIRKCQAFFPFLASKHTQSI